MRHEKARLVLELARRLASSAEGLTTEEMAQDLGVCRRTAERMRDAVGEVFPQMEVLPEGVVKRFRIPKGLDGFYQSPTTEELVELARAIDALRDGGHPLRAKTLAGLDHKVRSALKVEQRRRMTPDIDALSRAELTGVRAGPQPVDDPALVSAIRQALMGMCQVRFRYHGGSKPGSVRQLTPFGLLFDRMNYLVGAEGPEGAPRNWRLDRISDFQVLDAPGAPPEDFSLADYAASSFGIFRDEVEEVRLRIRPEAAEDALRWRFHPSQIVTPQADGSVLIAFRTSGMLELAWHLFTWCGAVEILAPERLQRTMTEELQAALAAHQSSFATDSVANGGHH